MILINGVGLDGDGRCVHYHQDNDVAALACARCRQYFACYQCHDELRDHHFVPCDVQEMPVLCGHCRHRLTRTQYARGTCPVCGHAFNPKCDRHARIYFKN